MNKVALLKHIKNKDNIKTFANEINNFELITYLFEIIESTSIEKYQSEKIIRYISKNNPKILYPYFDRMTKFLSNNNGFIKYGFILSIPNLLEVDICKKWCLVKEKYIFFTKSASIIEFCNTVKCIPKILKYNPKDEKMLITNLLKIERHTFYKKGISSKKCKDIAKNTILDCFDNIYITSNYKDEIIKFIQKCSKSRKKQVRKKSNRLLNKYYK